MNNELSFVLFSRQLLTQQVAEEYIRFLALSNKSLVLPDKCGDAEPVRTPFIEADLHLYASRLAKPHGRFFFNKGKPAFIHGEIWNLTHSYDAITPSPLFCTRWTGRIHARWAETIGFDALQDFIGQIFILTDSDFGFCTPTRDLKAKNTNATNLSFKGFNLQEHIPGLYWANFFSDDLTYRLGLIPLLAGDSEFSLLQGGGCLLKFGDSPYLDETSEVLRKQHALIKKIGLDNFFDIGRLEHASHVLYE